MSSGRRRAPARASGRRLVACWISGLLGLWPAWGGGAEPPEREPEGAPDLVEPTRAESAEPDGPAEDRWPERLGPFGVELDDGRSALEVGFAAQLRASLTTTDQAASGPGRNNELVAELRRVRLLLRGRFFDERLTTRFQLSTAPSSLELMDVWLDYRFSPWARLRLGQFKIPYTRHRAQSFTGLVLVDWSVAAKQFGGERQLGVSLHDGLSEGWSYAVGAFTGVNARASFERGLSQIYAEPLPNSSDLTDPAPPAELHPELVVRIAHAAEGIEAKSNSDAAGGGLRHHAGLSATLDAQPAEARDFLLRLAPELLLKAYHLSLNVVAHGGFFRAQSDDWTFGAVGLTAETAWRLHPHLELAGRYSRVDYLQALRADARLRAAELVAGAAAADRADVANGYRAAGGLHSEQEVAIGLNAYIIGDSLKWQHDVAWIHREKDAGGFHDVRARMQLQVAF